VLGYTGEDTLASRLLSVLTGAKCKQKNREKSMIQFANRAKILTDLRLARKSAMHAAVNASKPKA
jgi:hypothetical protein